MAIVYRSSTNSADGSATSVTCAAPTGLANDDILLYGIYKENTAVVTWPSGFTLIDSQAAADSLFTLHVAWKRAASESGSYTASWAGNVWSDGILLCYSGVASTGTPFDATATKQANGSETNKITLPSITTVTDNAMVVVWQGNLWGFGTTAPTGATQRSQNDDISAADLLKSPAGATGALTFTGSGGPTQTVGIAVALTPPGGGGGGTTYTDAGSATDIGTGSGAGVAILSDTGAALSIFRSTGAGIATFADSGAARLITVGSGPGVATSADAGSAVGALAGSGSDAAAYLDTGSGILRSVATGGDANAYLDTGGAASAWRGTGADAAMVSDMGSAVAALFGFGAVAAVLVDSGSGVLIAIGAGADIGPVELPYQGDAYRYDSSSAAGSIAGGTVLAGPSQGSATGSTGGSTVIAGPNQGSPTGPISGGTVLPPESII